MLLPQFLLGEYSSARTFPYHCLAFPGTIWANWREDDLGPLLSQWPAGKHPHHRYPIGLAVGC